MYRPSNSLFSHVTSTNLNLFIPILIADDIPGRALRHCAVELTDVFTDIFNTSLSQAAVPTCLKATTISPVAITPITLKCFTLLTHDYSALSEQLRRSLVPLFPPIDQHYLLV